MKQTRRLVVFVVVLVASFVASFVVSGGFDRPPAYSSTFSWTKLVDTTAATSYDTIDTLNGLTGSKIFRYRNLGHSDLLRGTIFSEVTALDTNAGGEFPDTTKDTIAFLIYSGFDSRPDSQWLVHKDSIEGGGGPKGLVHFSLPADSIGNFISFQFIAVLADSDNSVARDTLAIHYRATVDMQGKE